MLLLRTYGGYGWNVRVPTNPGTPPCTHNVGVWNGEVGVTCERIEAGIWMSHQMAANEHNEKTEA